MGEELNFQQRWGFRGNDNDFDSSSNESKSSDDPTLKKVRFVSNFVPFENDETSDICRFQEKGNSDPSKSGETKSKKAEKARRGRSMKVNLVRNERKKGLLKAVTRKKSKTSANEHAALEDLKNYMNSLLEDLKVTRENLIIWMKEEMQKLEAHETASVSERQNGNSRGKKVQLQNQSNKHKENAEIQHCKNFGKNMEIQHQNNFKGYDQVQQQKKLEKNVQMQHRSFDENIQLQHQQNTQENIQLRQQSTFASWARVQNCDGGTSERFVKRKNSCDQPDPNDHILALEYPGNYSQAVVPSIQNERQREQRLASSAKSNSKSSPSEQKVNEQQPKSIVLAIRAQNSKGRSSRRPAKGKKTTFSNDHQVTQDQIDYSQAIVPMASAENEKRERLGLPVEHNLSSDSYCQVAPSMHLTLPSMLTNSHVLNHRFDMPSMNSTQPRITGNQRSGNSERSTLLLGSGSHHGYFTGLQADERSRNFAHRTYFDHSNTMTSFIGNGFPVPLHQALNGSFNIPNHVSFESIPQVENNSTLGLRMIGGAIRLLGASQQPSAEQYIPSNFNIHSGYKPDGSLIAPYQNGYQFPK